MKLALNQPLIEQQHLLQLRPWFQAACARLETQVPGAAVAAAIRNHVAAECVQCGIKVAGDELLALIQGEVGTAESPRLQRLQRGYCARNGCDSYYYRVVFEATSEVDWVRCLNGLEAGFGARPAEPYSSGVNLARLIPRLWLKRSAVAVLLLTAALLARQFYLGGTIPFLREPEQFDVDRSGKTEAPDARGW